MTFNEINKAAEHLLQLFAAPRNGSIELPVKVEEIARFLAINVVAYPLENNLSGILVIKDGHATIGYNQNESRNRRRFTVAHEIGHFQMHSELHKDAVFADNNFMVMFRSNTQGDDSETAKREREANIFAAALLMPEQELMREIHGFRVDLGDEKHIKELSRKFEVSSTAMYYRLVNLLRR